MTRADSPSPFGPWTDAQFDAMSWHDNHVHALRLVEGVHGAGELVLDIDHIVEWIGSADGTTFRIVPASLRFTDVTHLRIALDYASAPAAMAPFSIHAIERRREPRDRYEALLWKIVLNWPAGELAFEARGFEQLARGRAVVSTRQHLLPTERGEVDSRS
jgi:hypothetical protein